MALLVTLTADKHPLRVDIKRAYARVVECRGDKHSVWLTIRAWINGESARVDGQHLFEIEWECPIPEKPEVNPVAWAYEQIKKAGVLGETEDC